MSYSNFGNTDLSFANLQGVNLTGSSFPGTGFWGVFMPGAIVTGADFSSAQAASIIDGGLVGTPAAAPTGCQFRDGAFEVIPGGQIATWMPCTYYPPITLGPGADLTVMPVGLGAARIDNANLSGWDLHGANFSGISMQNVNLVGANLSGANLSNADASSGNFGRVTGTGATLNGTDLTEVNLQGSTWANAKIANTQFYFTICPNGWRASASNVNQSCVGRGM